MLMEFSEPVRKKGGIVNDRVAAKLIATCAIVVVATFLLSSGASMVDSRVGNSSLSPAPLLPIGSLPPLQALSSSAPSAEKFAGSHPSSYPTFNNYAGYLGNSTIYPTVFPNVTYLPAESSSNVSRWTSPALYNQYGYNSTWPENLATIGTSNPTGTSFYQTVGGTSYDFEVVFSAGATGASQVYTTGCDTQYFSCSANSEEEVSTWTPYQELWTSTTSVPTGFWTDIQSSAVGLNMTAGNTANLNPGGSNSAETDALDIGLQLLGLAIPEIGDVLTAVAITGDLEGIYGGAGAYSDSGLSDNLASFDGTGSSNEWAVTQNGNTLNSSYSCPPASGPTLTWNYPKPNPCAPVHSQSILQEGQNTFGQGFQVETTSGIASSLSSALSVLGSITSGASISLGVQNNIEVYNPGSGQTFYGSTSVPGASTSITYNFAPAIALEGTVINSASGNRQDVSGATVTIEQSCTSGGTTTIDDFTETTGLQGQWNFFGNPSCTFYVSAADSQAFGTVGSPTFTLRAGTATAGSVYTFPRVLALNNYPLTVQMNGLVYQQTWSLSLQGATNYETSASTGTNQITFIVPNGTYTATPNPPTGYVSVPGSSSVTVAGTPPTTAVSLVEVFDVTFTETGLTPGATWTVAYSTYVSSSSGTTVEFYVQPNGTYSYSVGAVSGYTLSPSSGTITISGSSVNQKITYTPTSTYTVTFTETGLGSGYSWEAYIGSTGKTVTAGSTITFSSIAGTNNYEVESVVVSVGCDSAVEYVPSPTSGSVSAATHISVTYTKKTVTLGPLCITNPSGMDPLSFSEIPAMAKTPT
jgi:hypothetical protein